MNIITQPTSFQFKNHWEKDYCEKTKKTTYKYSILEFCSVPFDTQIVLTKKELMELQNKIDIKLKENIW